MSKVVRSIGRGIKKIVSGVTKAVKTFAKSKVGKVLLIAAAAYFGVPAIMGVFGAGGAAATAGLSGLSGAAANIGAAWSSLGTAGSALLAGEFGTAASALGTGVMGGSVAGPSAALAGAAQASPWVTLPSGQLALASEAAGLGASVAPAASKGIVSGLMSSPYTAPALISGGTQLIGGAMQGYGQQKALEDQRAYDQQTRDEQRAYDRQMAEEQAAGYNRNMGTRLWGEAPTTGLQPMPLPFTPQPIAAPQMPRYDLPPIALMDDPRAPARPPATREPVYDARLGRYV